MLLAARWLRGKAGCRCRAGKRPGAASDGGRPRDGVASGARRRTASDRPVPEARVLAFAIGRGEAWPAAGRVGDRRRWPLPLRPPAGRGRTACWSRRPGFRRPRRTRYRRPPTASRSRSTVKGSSVVGRVFAAGAPAAGARVLLAPDAGGPMRETIDARGRGLRVRRAGRRALRAARGDRRCSRRRSCAAIEAGDGPARRRSALDMSPARPIAGGWSTTRDRARRRARADRGRRRAPGEDPLPTLVSSDAAGSFSGARGSRAATG